MRRRARSHGFGPASAGTRLSSGAATQHELAEEPNPDAGRPFHPGRILAVGVRGAGDVEVRPRISVHELAEEPAGGDAPGRTAARVLDVGDVGFHELAVVVP